MTGSVSRVAFVLAGGAARGAYEVGVVSYVFDAVARALGRPIPVDILCGTSVGAINACALAAHAASSLVRHWTSLRLREMTRVNMRALRRLLASLVAARPTPMAAADAHRGGILDGAGIERLVRDEIAFEKIHEHVRAQRLTALTVSTTDIATGKTVAFVERAEGGAAHWGRDPTVVVRAVRIGADHTLASAAVPFLFPAVRIGEDFYCDGGLRVTRRLLRRIAEWEGAGEADLLSYLLFDGPFAARLIELGRRDADARHDELCALFEARLRQA